MDQAQILEFMWSTCNVMFRVHRVYIMAIVLRFMLGETTGNLLTWIFSQAFESPDSFYTLCMQQNTPEKGTNGKRQSNLIESMLSYFLPSIWRKRKTKNMDERLDDWCLVEKL